MKFFKKKIFFSVCILAFTLLLITFLYRSLPILTAKESFISFFPKKEFYKKIQSPTPCWMREQILYDLSPFKNAPITIEKLEKTYQQILSPKNTFDKSLFSRYRICNNKLYKFSPSTNTPSSKNTPLEKAIKTLLHFISIPDCEFLLSIMDGLVEPHLDPLFHHTPSFSEQAPLLGQAKRKEPHSKYVILIPDKFSLSQDWLEIQRSVQNSSTPWDKKINKVIWRGSFTDVGKTFHHADFSLDASIRLKLCQLSQKHSEWLDAAFTNAKPAHLLKLLEIGQTLKPFLNKRELLKCKYLPVLDGHMCTYPGYQWSLLSNSIALKQESDQVQWFYRALQPYVHYIPIRQDLSDFVEKVEWAKKNDEKMKKIAENATKFAQNNLLLADNYLYLYLLFNAYAGYQKIDFASCKKNMASQGWVCIQYQRNMQFKKSIKKRFPQLF